MTLGNIHPILTIIVGILILGNPKLLSTLIGIYLIVTGLMGLGVLRF